MTQTRLSAAARESYRGRLWKMAGRLSGGVSDLEAEALRPAAESSAPIPAAHEADRAVREGEEEVARTLLVAEEHLLSEVRAALERLAAGTFGQCEKCGKPITRARLDAMPYTRTCICCAGGERGTADE